MLHDLAEQLTGEAQGLRSYFEDPAVTDLLINGLESFYIEQKGVLSQKPNPFTNSERLFHFIERLLIPNQKQLNAAAPYLDGSLLDGSRFNVVFPPLAHPGPLISIRKPVKGEPIPLHTFAPLELIEWIKDQVKKQKTFLITGGTGVGKTTFLASLLYESCQEERVVLIEEVSEIRVPLPHLISLQARSATPEGRGAVNLRTLVRTALRIRPDRLILGECRGPEAFEMLQAMNTGHGGSLGTLHANSARGALRRLESLALTAGLEVSLKVIREWIASEVFGIIHLEKSQGVRQVAEVLLVCGLEGEVFRTQLKYSTRT